MSAVLGIARREVRERRVLLAAAVTLSLLALALQIVPAPVWTHELGEALALVLFLAFPAAAALAVGSSLIGRDLAERRLSFYLSRPLSAGALWAGKFLGGASLVLGAFLFCYFPITLSTGGLAPHALALWTLLLLGLMGFAHVITAMYRSGSRLFVLDLVLGALFVTVFGALVRRLVVAGVGAVVLGLDGALPVAAATALVGTMVAAAAQLACGRADPHRGHIALSTAGWTLALATLGGLAVWSAWLLGVTPADVGGVGHPLFAAPGGSALIFKGASSQGRGGFSPVFLMDGDGGTYVRLAPERLTPPAFAADGGRAVWVAPAASWWEIFNPNPVPAFDAGDALLAVPDAGRAEPWYPRRMLVVARLDQGDPVIVERPLEPRDASLALAVAADGQRVLLSGRSSVSLVDATSGRLLAGVSLSDVMSAEFLPDGVVRIFQKARGPGRAAFIVRDWNAMDGAQVERARVPGDFRRFLLLAWHGDLAVVSTDPRERALIDARSGAVRVFHSATADAPGAALVLSGDRVAVSLGEEVRIVTRGGDTVASMPIEGGARVHALREPAPNELAVGLWTLSLEGRRTLFLDAATGALRREEKGLLPAGARVSGPQPGPGSLASRLFTDLDGALIALEADGRRRVIVPVPGLAP